MSIPIFRHRSRSANTRLFRKRLPKGLGFIPLCVLLFNLLWMGCECGDVTPTYKVTFNTNGGTAIDPQPVKQGAVVNKPADPTKAGFVFAGWYSDAALTQVYDFKAKATKDITLYAKWSPIYTVTFDSNEGTPVASRKVPEGSAFSKPADPTRTGYVFDGWYSDAALTQVYDFAAKVTKNITLYAKWARPYMVTFNSNGGTAVASQNVPEGGTVTKPTDPTRQGYSFAGWYSDEALTQVYDFAAKVTKSITLYAKWAPIYTVMFNTNGGTPVTPRNVPEGATFPKPADPTRKDYLFAGWYSDVALTQVYDFAAAVTKNITLYAKWTRTYTVVFASRGGTVIPSQTVQKGGMVTKPADPTREGFTFENWYSDVALTQVYDFAAAVNADITLYAKWTPKAGVMIYTVTFDTRGGTLIPPLAVAANGVATRPAADPTRENYLFENWYSDSTLTQVYDFALKVTKAITLYAKWTPTYTVTFDSGGGTAVATQTVLKDATVTKPVDPTRQDYVFENWYSDSTLTQVYDFALKVTKAITLYAKWMRTYTVTFNTNGGTAVAAQTVAQADTVVRPADPTRKDYLFGGWYSDAALTQVYDFSAKVTKTIMLYAKWTPIMYTVTFDSRGGTAIAAQTVSKDGTATKPTNPTKADSTFVNWYADSGLTQVYDFATGVTGDITLYAKWMPITYTVTFDSRGGTAVAAQTVAQADTVVRPADPTRVGYTFGGWYSDEALTQVYDFATGVTAAITLYAKWKPTYTVTFDSGGGTAVAAQTVAQADTVVSPTDPTRAGFAFGGWYSDEALTQVYDFATGVTAAITLYAKWKPTYTVTFDSRGGTAVAAQTVAQADTVVSPTDPTRAAFVFTGWYSDEALTQVYDFATGVTAAITLYAKWGSASAGISFSDPSEKIRSIIGLREFMLTVEVSGVRSRRVLDFVASASQTPPAWAAVAPKAGAQRTRTRKRVFTPEKNSRGIYFTLTDKYDGTAMGTLTTVAVGDTDYANTPVGIMKPGHAYYVHVYENGVFVKTSPPVTLNDYPERRKLPRQTGQDNLNLYAPWEKQDKKFDSGDPDTYFFKRRGGRGMLTPLATQPGLSGYLWGVDSYYTNPSSDHSIVIEVVDGELDLYPFRMIVPANWDWVNNKNDIRKYKDKDGNDRVHPSGPRICPTTTDNKVIFQSSPNGVLPFPKTEFTMQNGVQQRGDYVNFKNEKLFDDPSNILDVLIDITSRKSTSVYAPGHFGYTMTVQCTNPTTLTQVITAGRVLFSRVGE